MPYAVKHKDKDLYISGTTSQKAVRYDHGLVEKKYAKIYATESGAKSARGQWALTMDRHGYELVKDQAMYDLVEIVEIEF